MPITDPRSPRIQAEILHLASFQGAVGDWAESVSDWAESFNDESLPLIPAAIRGQKRENGPVAGHLQALRVVPPSDGAA
jgi:hypothetical protein